MQTRLSMHNNVSVELPIDKLIPDDRRHRERNYLLPVKAIEKFIQAVNNVVETKTLDWARIQTEL